MKDLLKKFLPDALLVPAQRAGHFFRTVLGAIYDHRRYLRWSLHSFHQPSKENLRALLTERYHNIEKGLSLPSPRPGFGTSVVNHLIDVLTTYRARFGDDSVSLHAEQVLFAYRDFNLSAGLNPAEIPGYFDIENRFQRQREGAPAGVVPSNSKPHVLTSEDLESFVTSRRSVRNFSRSSVHREQIITAVRFAQSAPAVCNRQFAKVHYSVSPECIRSILAIQGGARGFSDNVPALAVLTVDSRSYWGAEERYQGWIDGGLFAMNFMLGLHAQGLGSVALNWSKLPSVDRDLRKLLPLQSAESVIMMVAFGYPDADSRSPVSPRVNTADVCSEIRLANSHQ